MVEATTQNPESPTAIRSALDTWSAIYDANIMLAAVGNRDAQVAIARGSFDLALVQGSGEMMSAARWWSRMAAAHGLRDDRFLLAGVLAVSAADADKLYEPAVGASYRSEAIAVLRPLVDSGDQAAIDYSNDLAGGPKPVVVMIPDAPEFAQYLWAVDMAGQA